MAHLRRLFMRCSMPRHTEATWCGGGKRAKKMDGQATTTVERAVVVPEQSNERPIYKDSTSN